MRQRAGNFVVETRESQKQILELLRLEPGREQIQSEEFQEAVKAAQNYVTFWKRKHNYSSNDDRFKTATYTQILQDILEERVFKYMYEYERFDPDTNEFVRKRELNPEYDKQEAEEIAGLLNKAMRTTD